MIPCVSPILIKLRGGEKVGHKPGSVLSTASSFRGQLSIWDACYQTPQAVPKNGTGKKPTIVPPTLLPTGVYRASTSRCCWCALTAPLHPYPLTLGDFRCLIFDSISNLKSPISNRGRYLSVALSSRSLALGVTQQVWFFGSPDFPQTSFR
jgi:hypothetical protein